jgi:hypothetical protein
LIRSPSPSEKYPQPFRFSAVPILFLSELVIGRLKHLFVQALPGLTSISKIKGFCQLIYTSESSFGDDFGIG